MTQPRWLPCVGYPGYEVSDDGRVRSLPRVITRRNGTTQPVKGCELSPFVNKLGYHLVRLSGTSKSIHILACTAFNGASPSPSHEVRHLDGNPRNNRLENLKWGTKSENAYDRVGHQTDHNARKTRCPRGHPYDSIRLRPEGCGMGRRCSICDADATRRRDAKRRADKIAAAKAAVAAERTS